MGVFPWHLYELGCGHLWLFAPRGSWGRFAAQEAGNELEEVIVTAERRSTDIQNVAASVSVRTGEELATQGRYTTKQILEDIPGLVAVDNSSVNVGTADVQGNNITIRGITPGAQCWRRAERDLRGAWHGGVCGRRL